jgi:hypothetical protein
MDLALVVAVEATLHQQANWVRVAPPLDVLPKVNVDKAKLPHLAV